MRRKKRYFLKQKLSGLVMIAIGVISVMLLADATFAVIAVPLGLYLIVTKEQVMMFKKNGII